MKKIEVSILIPCRNEVSNIEQCLENVYSFELPEGGFEVIIIDGQSDDGTIEKLNELKKDKYHGLQVINNKYRTVPYAMNMGIKQAKGIYIVRVDVRCVHPKNYLVELLKTSKETGADNVGGVLEPIGVSYFQKAIAASYRSRISMGGALRQREDFIGETDAVYGGCFKKSKLIEVGMYDEEMVRNQDDELSFRIRKSGGKIIQTSKLRIKYYPRKKLKQLYKQFSQYGFWKVRVIKKHPMQASLRHLLPSGLVVSLSLLGIISLFSQDAFFLFLLISLCYFTAVAIEAKKATPAQQKLLWPAIFVSIVIIHIGYGIGFLSGILNSLLKKKPKYFATLSR